MNENIKTIPIIDCPICKTKDVPLSHKATMSKDDKTIEVWECSNCGKVPNLGTDIKVKRYISIKELRTMDYKESKHKIRKEGER